MSLLNSLFKKKQDDIKRSNSISEDGFITANSEYVVFDLETTGVSIYYSEPVQISAIKVKGGKIVDTFNELVKPRRECPEEAIAVHHITNEMLKDKLSFKEVYPKFREFVGSLPLVGYNIKGYDLLVLNSQIQFMNGNTFSTECVDVFVLVRNLMKLADYKLVTVAMSMGIDTAGAHDALADCNMTNEVFMRMIDREKRIELDTYVGRTIIRSKNLSEESQAVNILREMLIAITKDSNVSREEFANLAYWMIVNDKYRDSYPFNVIIDELAKICADGKIDRSELAYLEDLIEECIDPVKNCKHIPISSIEGKNIVITGDFEIGDKTKVTSLITDRGGIVENGVTKKTDYVVVGALGSKAWVAGDYGNKIKKALENMGKGQNIQIVREADFLRELKIK